MSGSLELIETATLAAEAGCRPMVRGRRADDGADLPETGPLAAVAFDSPLGRMVIEADGLGLRALRWGQGIADERGPPDGAVGAAAGRGAGPGARLLRGADAPVYPAAGTAGHPLPAHRLGFINEIPHGATLRYGELAELVGSAPRAVARACGANPLPLVIPCHRVVGAMSDLGGYSAPGGPMAKRFLLRLEGALGGPARPDLASFRAGGNVRQRSFEF